VLVALTVGIVILTVRLVVISIMGAADGPSPHGRVIPVPSRRR